MSLQEQQLGDYNSELVGYNSAISNYQTKLDAYKQEVADSHLQNEQLSQYLEGTGLLAVDVVHKIITSKAFAMFTTYVKKSLEDPNSLSSKLLGSVKGHLKGVIQKSLGIDLDKPENFVWKGAFDQMSLTKDDIKSAIKGDLGPIRSKLQDQFVKTVQDKAPEIMKTVLKDQGFDMDATGNNKYMDQLRATNVSLDDLLSAGRGDVRPLMQKMQPVLRSAVIDKVSSELNLPDVPEGQHNPFSEALKTVSLDDIQKALKGDYSGVTEKLAPVAKQMVTEQLRQRGVELPEPEVGAPTSTLSFNDVKRAVSGDFGGVIDGIKPQVQKYVNQKLKDVTGFDLDASAPKSPLGLDDLQNLAAGNVTPVFKKFIPQMKQQIASTLQDKLGLDIDVSKPTSPLSMDDLQAFSRGEYQPIVDKFQPQISKFISGKIQDVTGLPLDLSQAPISLDDLQALKAGGGLRLLAKYEPQIRQQIKQQLLDQAKIPQQYADQIDGLPLTMGDVRNAGRGNYSPLIQKLKQKIQTETGVSPEDLQTSFANVQTQVDQTRTQATQAVSQVQAQASRVQQQVQDTGDEIQGIGRMTDEELQAVQQGLPRPSQQVRSGTQMYYENPAFDASTVGNDVSSSFRQPGAQMRTGIAQSIAERGSKLLGSIGETAAGIGGLGAQIGVGIGASQIQNETARNLTTIGGSAGAGAVISTGSRLLSGASTAEALGEGISAGGEMGLMAGAGVGISYIPDPVERFAAQTAMNAGMTGYQAYSASTALQGALAPSSTSVATAGSEAVSTVSDFAAMGADLATAEVVTAPVDTVPVVGEVVQAAIGLAALGSSLYFGIKDLFGLGSSDTPPPQPDVAQASEQFGV